MLKIVFLLFVTSILNGNILFNKIKNLIGDDQFTIHNRLINNLFKNTGDFYLYKSKLDYKKILKVLKNNGLLKLKFKNPTKLNIEFSSTYDSIKMLKILNETLRSMGYYYYFTKSAQYDKHSKRLTWNIVFQTEYVLDPLILVQDLKIKSCDTINIQKINPTHWKYEIEVKNAKLKEAIKVNNNEKVVLQKPLRPYFIEVNNGIKLQIISRKLNHWFPYIVFYDKHLNIIKTVKKDRVYKGYKVKIPIDTKYIKITDLYTLINIKRGLSVIVR